MPQRHFLHGSIVKRPIESFAPSPHRQSCSKCCRSLPSAVRPNCGDVTIGSCSVRAQFRRYPWKSSTEGAILFLSLSRIQSFSPAAHSHQLHNHISFTITSWVTAQVRIAIRERPACQCHCQGDNFVEVGNTAFPLSHRSSDHINKLIAVTTGCSLTLKVMRERFYDSARDWRLLPIILVGGYTFSQSRLTVSGFLWGTLI